MICYYTITHMKAKLTKEEKGDMAQGPLVIKLGGNSDQIGWGHGRQIRDRID